MTEIRRCNAAERRIFNMPIDLGSSGIQPGTEPALGTLDEKLGILVRRHGGRTSPPKRLTTAEMIELGVTIEEQGVGETSAPDPGRPTGAPTDCPVCGTPRQYDIDVADDDAEWFAWCGTCNIATFPSENGATS